MAAVQGPSLDGFRPLGPVGEGGEAALYRSVFAPENEQRRDQLAADVCFVVHEVDRFGRAVVLAARVNRDRKSTRLNSSHSQISYAVFCLKKKKKKARSNSDRI